MAANSSLVGFPQERPNCRIFHHGWFLETHIRVFNALIQPSTKVIFELGSWYGSSTKWLAENSNAVIYAIDLWDDDFILNDNHYNSNYELSSMLRSHPLYPTFLVNLWEYKDRIIPLRMKTLDGLQYLHAQGIKPDLIYIDADHHYQAAKNDIMKSLELFPDAILIGDDYGNYQDVRNAVHECADTYLKTVHVDNNHCWTYCCINSSTGQNIPPKNQTGKLSALINRYKKSQPSSSSSSSSSPLPSSSSSSSSSTVTHEKKRSIERDEDEKKEEIPDSSNQNEVNETAVSIPQSEHIQKKQKMTNNNDEDRKNDQS